MFPCTFIKKKLIKHFHQSSLPLTPPQPVLDTLFSNPASVSHFQTEIMTYYAIINYQPDEAVILGPVNSVPYSSKAIHIFFRYYQIPKQEALEYTSHFQYIPQYSLDTFINQILLLNYILNRKALTKLQYEAESMYGNVKNSIPASISSYQIEQLENDSINVSYDLEKKIIPYIETGNVTGLKEMKVSHLEIPQFVGNYSDNPLQQRLIIFIITQTIFSRAAIRGGLYPQTALSLMELYIRQAVSMTSPSCIDDLLMQSSIDYTARVQKEKLPVNINKNMYQCLIYIRNNVTRPITAADVSSFSGYSRSYFSMLFKKELGFTVSDFIVSCKLYEAQKLLKYTDRSISAISSSLCFANQSHFQRQFKKKFGMTPMHFRKENQL